MDRINPEPLTLSADEFAECQALQSPEPAREVVDADEVVEVLAM
ncbi:hypothetical protein O987_21910 [Comamonas testosteroni TK102]|uniref:Uncharacterized protein n=1 Tax=Comamonas testosteroni TK102 TaxID=1392005 RepID=A0A076PXD2_COMTE|nr:hypothetical protein O987_21910 [Comamonas testosteroni TK102]